MLLDSAGDLAPVQSQPLDRLVGGDQQLQADKTLSGKQKLVKVNIHFQQLTSRLDILKLSEFKATQKTEKVASPVPSYVLEEEGIPGYGRVGEHQLCLPCNAQPKTRIYLIGEHPLLLALSSEAQTQPWLKRRPSQSPLHLIHLCNVGSVTLAFIFLNISEIHLTSLLDTQRSKFIRRRFRSPDIKFFGGICHPLKCLKNVHCAVASEDLVGHTFFLFARPASTFGDAILHHLESGWFKSEMTFLRSFEK